MSVVCDVFLSHIGCGGENNDYVAFLGGKYTPEELFHPADLVFQTSTNRNLVVENGEKMT
jgi:hypothetical protein